MRIKQIFSIVLAMCLVFLNNYPVFAMEADDISEDRFPISEQGNGSLDNNKLRPLNNQTTTIMNTATGVAISLQQPGTMAEPSTLPVDTASGAVISLQQPYTLAEPSTLPVDTATGAAISLRQPYTMAEPPTLLIESTTGAAIQGIYGTLSYIPANTIRITVMYSFEGETYYAVTNKDEYGSREWDLTGLEKGVASLTQLCIGENDSPLKAYLREAVNTLYVKLQITQMIQENSVETYTEAVKLSHHRTWEAPKVPPDFTAGIVLTGQGYLLMGKCTDFLPSTTRITPMYSLDGDHYQVIYEVQPYDWKLDKLGAEDEAELTRLNNQICAESSVEPLKSYLSGQIDSFYVRLQITLENGSSYNTKSFQIDRGMAQPLPEEATLTAIFPSSMRVLDRRKRPYYTYGKYQITVRENADKEDIYAILPKTVPVEIQIGLKGSLSVPITGYIETAVSWKALPDMNLKAGETLIIENAANSLLIPTGTQIHTPLGIYILSRELGFDGGYSRDEIRLAVNVIGRDEKAEVSLRGSLVEDATVDPLPISLAFSLKPSGATKIMAYSYIQGDKGWTELCDLLTKRAIDSNQSEQLYGYIDILQPTATSYQRYLQGDVDGLLIALTIEGGVYDGETLILPWPGEYNPPPAVPKIGGSGGNENNAGNGGNNDSNGSGNNGGQRPDLPGGDQPPVAITPSVTPGPKPEPTPDSTPIPSSKPEQTPNPTLIPSPQPEQTPNPTPVPSLQPEQTPNPTPVPSPQPEQTPNPTPIPSTQPEQTPNPTSVPSSQLEQKPNSSPVPSHQPEQTPNPSPVLSHQPEQTPNPTPVLSLLPEQTPKSSPVQSSGLEVMPSFIPALSPKLDTTPGSTPALSLELESIPDSASALSHQPEPTPDTTPTANPDAAVSPTDNPDTSKPNHGERSDQPDVDDNILQEEKSVNASLSMTLTEPVDNELISSQPSEQNELRAESQDIEAEDDDSIQVFNTQEPTGQTAAAPMERTAPKKQFPKVLTIGLLTVGVVTVTGITVSTTSASASSGIVGKLITALRKVLFKK